MILFVCGISVGSIARRNYFFFFGFCQMTTIRAPGDKRHSYPMPLCALNRKNMRDTAKVLNSTLQCFTFIDLKVLKDFMCQFFLMICCSWSLMAFTTHDKACASSFTRTVTLQKRIEVMVTLLLDGRNRYGGGTALEDYQKKLYCYSKFTRRDDHENIYI